MLTDLTSSEKTPLLTPKAVAEQLLLVMLKAAAEQASLLTPEAAAEKKRLLKYGTDCPLHNAAAFGEPKDLASLIGLCLDINEEKSFVFAGESISFTPIEVAAIAKKPENIYLLGNEGALLNQQNNYFKRTALHWAADGGDKETILACLSMGGT